ncbi:MAG: porin family protein [Bradyrhizobium sp.]|uniref:outer membrane protein n=1 Tax=Bradyrhizobium sp. TaxID=376 RepID=UPI001C2A21ED|nr:outer membrane beta-barrel protein [Bradyrhizobium sp.]MBU6461449.1 outer membrane beta-barrel protein [Pseudomonadota bacterium]MDE2068511.1 porin family protein [Bradyrhizobium sp.]MDE2472228.1 porin family protein [Bradyrhizobium sp.]
MTAAVAVGTMLSIGAASAADLAARPYTKAPPMVPEVYTWTGFYVGGNVGAIGFGGNAIHQCTSPAGVASGTGCELVPDLGLNDTGVLGGVQAGYNWQSGRWVFGLEGDIDGTGLRGSAGTSGVFPVVGGGVTPSITVTDTARLDWFSTVRGRLGVTSGAALFYVTGGAAFGGVQASANYAGPVNGFPSSVSSTRGGWTAGGGIEWGFAPQWSAKLEGLYYDLGSVSSIGTSVPPINTFTDGTRFEINGWVARIGVNYRFGGPVVARY